MFSKAFTTAIYVSLIITGISASSVELARRQVNVGINDFTYKGCLSDPDHNYRTLMYAIGRESTMTLDRCSKLCGNMTKYRYFGVQNGNECWCDYSIKTYGGGGTRLDETMCNKPCQGNTQGSTTKCGGSNAMNVYENTLIPEPVNKAIVNASGPNNTIIPWEFQNCYKDIRNEVRVLDVRLDPAQGGVTAETCTTTCGLMGYKLAGLEIGRECWCGNELRYSVTSADDPKIVCKQACDKDTTESCGYIGLASVYARKSL